MNVKELREKLADLPDELEIVKSTCCGNYAVREIEQTLVDIYQGGTIAEVFYPEFEPDEGDTRKTVLFIR